MTNLPGLHQSSLRLRKAYDKAYNHLATGRGNVIRRAQQLRDKGAKTGASLPAQLLLDDEALDDEEESLSGLD